ncbi:MAG TPA: GTP cyclohydrolase II RibA [Actinomycetota bacterium]|nr:GTP cyclohydrolase II RibA [Actinomycetota bacterium]
MSETAFVPHEVANLTLPTPFGEWQTRAFEWAGSVHLCLCRGRIGDGEDVLVRMHSECVTGDALGSLRCDCGIQLRHSLRAIAAEGRGVLVYSTGHEGRGIGLVNKLRAYMLQDTGFDTAEANEHLGFQVDERIFGDVAACLRDLGVRSVRLMSNNPDKAAALEAGGIAVRAVVGLPTVAHARNVRYLSTKQAVMGHAAPMGAPLPDGVSPPPDVGSLLGEVRATTTRPYVVVKYAQTLDGRIATSTGDARWISGEEERRTSHALRAACDAVLVGVGTVLVDDPQLTVRMVPGASPIRVVLDSELRIPDRAQVLSDDAATIVVTTRASTADRRAELRDRGVSVVVVPADPHGVDLGAALEALLAGGIRSVLVEGGARMITSFLSLGLADRLVVGIAPRVLGSGTEAVNDLGITEVASSIRIERRAVHVAGDDVLIAGDLAR